MRTPRAIRTRLLVWLLVPLSAIAALEATETYFTARATSEALYDKTLAAVLLTVSENVLASGGDLLSENVLEVLTENLGDQLFYHVAGPDNTFVTGYSGYPRPPADVVLQSGRPAFYDGRYQGDPVRVAAMRQLVSGRDLNGWITVTAWQTVRGRVALSLELFGQSLLRLAILVGAAGVIVWLALHTGLKPLTELRTALENRSPGELSPIRRPVPIELRSLVASLNALLAKVRDERQARERFIGDAAHQLRNPVAALKAQAEVAGDARTAAEMRARLARIAEVSARLALLVNRLLSSARANSPPGPGQGHEDFDLVGLTREAAREHAPRAVRKGQEFSFEAAETRIGVHGDRTLVGEAIANLIDNAIVHNPPGTAVSVAVARRNGTVEVVIEDDGPGIPGPAHAAVMEPFVSLDDESEGSGLGLSIARDIARAHQGQVRSSPGRNGRGSRFELVLTTAAAEAAADDGHRRRRDPGSRGLS